MAQAIVGIYECCVSRGLVSKGKRVMGYYGLLPLVELLGDNPLDSRVIKDLKDKRWDFEFPVLVVSYYLGSGDLPKRKKIPKSETWEAVINAEGEVLKVGKGGKLELKWLGFLKTRATHRNQGQPAQKGSKEE